MAPGRRAKSVRKRQIEYANKRENLIQEAITQYTNPAWQRTVADGTRQRRKGLRTICNEVTNKHAKATGRRIMIGYMTLDRRIKGRKSPTEARSAQAHLTKAKNTLACDYAIEVANRGFPLSHKRLKEHINKVIRQRIPSFAGVGLRYTERFVDQNHNRLSMYSSRALDGKRGGAVNTNTMDAWFKLLGEVMEDYGFTPDVISNMDETGVHPDSGGSEKVIGPQGKNVVYQT